MKAGNIHYVYVHFRASDLAPFYVGKGKNNRAWAKTSSQRNQHWMNVFNKHGLVVEVVQDCMSEDDAFLLEMWLIAKFKHEGYDLANMTDGGEGASGCNVKPVVRSDGRRFNSIVDAVTELRANGHPAAIHSPIISCLNGDTLTAYGYTWAEAGSECPEYECPRLRQAKTISKPVYSSNGVKHASFMEAERWLKSIGFDKADKVNIRNAAYGKYKSAYGYAWSCDGVPEHPTQNPKERSDITQRKMILDDRGGSFHGLVAAVKSCVDDGWPKASASKISEVCRGKRRVAYGRTWRYADV